MKKEKNILSILEKKKILIQKKKYGICEQCQEPIPVARLEALPYSTNCKDCAVLLDS